MKSLKVCACAVIPCLIMATSVLAGNVNIGKFDWDVQYTVWNTDRAHKRVGDPIKQGIPLAKGKSATVSFNGYASSVETQIIAQKTAGLNNSFDMIGTIAANTPADLDAVLLNLVGTAQLVFPSLFDANDAVNLVGFIDVREYVQNGGSFSFDPNNKLTFNRALDIAGPEPELLDTRAIVHLAMGEIDRAIADLQEVIGETPTASKYFHLAAAYLKANNRDAAAAAFQRARVSGLDLDVLHPLERPTYELLLASF